MKTVDEARIAISAAKVRADMVHDALQRIDAPEYLLREAQRIANRLDWLDRRTAVLGDKRSAFTVGKQECSKCKQVFEYTVDNFYATTPRGGQKYLRTICKACWNQRNTNNRKRKTFAGIISKKDAA